MRHNRRDMMKFGLTTAALSSLQMPAVVRADEDEDDESEITRRYRTRPEDGFDPIHVVIHDIEDKYYRHWIIGQAAQILHTNFRHIKVARNAYNIPSLSGRPAYSIDGDAYSRSNIDAHPEYGASELLWYQLSILRLPDSAQDDEDEGPPFPPIHIYPMYEENDVHGRAPVGIVDIKWEGENVSRRTGEFKVKLNLYHLGAKGVGSDPFHWASVIAHEMLHNLGHKHNLMEYVDGRQINAFHRAVHCGGTYTGRQRVGHFGCHPPI